ncbi:MAG TPA: adenosine deaminase family protein [Myxococcota bacterium]|nr:adenosine deaminase family protein [Myxococcota bacterium]HQK50343.1 adenosine deaminase family protein [Myxococcota bacterium]
MTSDQTAPRREAPRKRPPFPGSDALIRALPKTDLHVHLDGSLRIPTLIELARQRGVALPSETEEGLRELVFKDRYANLVEYLAGFNYTTAVMQDPEALERVAYELAEDNYAEGVRYFEVRFAPQLHCNSRMGMDEVLKAVNRGLQRATRKWNRKLTEGGAGRPSEPEYVYAITVCALRYFNSHMSEYYRDWGRVHPYTPEPQIFGLASLELAQAAVAIRDRHGIPISGFDLAGREKGYPAETHREAYAYAHKNFLKKTVHAGEAYGPESIFQAITDLHADRIGHGYYLLSPNMVTSAHVQDRQEYVRRLAEYIADRRITIEVCLTSNLQTNPRIGDLGRHAFRKMREARLSTTLCTDNRLVSNTTVSKEVRLAVEHFGLTSRELRNIIIYGFKRSFYPGSYTEKRNYVRKIIDFYDQVEKDHMPPGGFWRSDDEDENP